MSRPRTPSNLHEIKGNYYKNPQRRRSGEPKPKAGIGPAPVNPSTNWKSCWDELVGIVCPGVLGDSDRIWLERAARLLAQSRDPEAAWTTGKESALQGYLAKMGLNPSDRARLSIPPSDDDSGDKFFD